jgi:hypothetical protein
MPIMTTFEITRGEVAAEPLMSCRAKATTNCAARLRGYAQGSPVSFRNVDSLDRITLSNGEKPLDGAIDRGVGADHIQAIDAGMRFQLLAKSEGQIGHAIEIGLASLVDPTKQLLGSKAFFSQAFTKSLQAMKIKVEQIGRHGFQRVRQRVQTR